MYYALAFLPNEWGKFQVRSLKIRGYKTLDSAKAAILKSGKEGYVKKLGNATPLWSNAK